MNYTHLNPSAHGHLRFKSMPIDKFVAGLQEVELLIDDIWPMACRAPVAFVREIEFGQPIIKAVCLLGRTIERDSALNVRDFWAKGALPSLLHAYPFGLQEVEQGFRVMVDEGFPGLSTGVGEPLFDETGAHSATLTNILALLRVLSERLKISRQFGQTLAQLNLLRPIDSVHSSQQFFTVDEQALAALSASQVMVLRRRQWLGLAYAQIMSLAYDYDRTLKAASDSVRSPLGLSNSYLVD
jgi:hypothetical protein